MQIKPTSLSINQLLGAGNEQYVIPTYQRRYSWRERQVWELVDDILLLDENDTHLLGSIVCLVGHYAAGLNRLELVDGQQRLTTIAILLECCRQTLCAAEAQGEAAEIARLLTSKAFNGPALKKISLDSIDSEEFDRLVANELEGDFQNEQLRHAFHIVREWLAELALDEIKSFLFRLNNQAMVIRLDVSDAKDAFKLFETINNRGLRLSPTDIIKNFLLGNAARFSEKDLDSARSSWTALIQNLDGTSSDAFFRYYLMAQTTARLTASEVVGTFKTLFMNDVKEAASLPERHLYADEPETDEEVAEETAEDSKAELHVPKKTKKSFKVFLGHLVQCAKIYGELVLVKTGDARIDRQLRNLRMIKAVQTYGFLMHLRVGACDEKLFRSVLKLTENFVLRRHVCRERSNDTEALFAKLCSIDPANPVQATREAYRALCPPDEKFSEEFANANFPANLIDRARYCLERIEASRHGARDELHVLGAADVHVEHIMPQKIKTKRAKDEFGDWVSYLGEKAESLHPKYVTRIGNLTLFSGALNIGASNSPFTKKKQAYQDSGVLITRELLELQNFKFSTIEKRSNELALEAVALWPRP